MLILLRFSGLNYLTATLPEHSGSISVRLGEDAYHVLSYL